MYDVAKFIKPKKEDWDNGCGPTQQADMEAVRYERTRGIMGEIMRKHLAGQS